ncbi:hypothetical protein Tco_0113767 [Tanacetum coccineum]
MFGVSACTARQMVFSSLWLTAKKESGSPLSNGFEWLVQEGTALGKDMSNPLYGCDGLPKTVRLILLFIEFMLIRLMLLFLDVAILVSAACCIAAATWYMLVALLLLLGIVVSADDTVPADYVPAGHLLISADRCRIC